MVLWRIGCCLDGSTAKYFYQHLSLQDACLTRDGGTFVSGSRGSHFSAHGEMSRFFPISILLVGGTQSILTSPSLQLGKRMLAITSLTVLVEYVLYVTSLQHSYNIRKHSELNGNRTTSTSSLYACNILF